MAPCDGPPASSLSIRPDPGEIHRTSLWLARQCRERGVPPEPIERLDLCLNEVLANLLDHGGAGTLQKPVELALQIAATDGSGSARLTVRDEGRPFDPLEFQPRQTPRTLAEAVPGGLGLKLVRTFSDDLSYARVGDRNELTLVVCWPSAA